MEELITRERARAFIKENKIVDAAGWEAAILAGGKVILEEMLKAEQERQLGYAKHDVKNKDTDNSKASAPSGCYVLPNAGRERTIIFFGFVVISVRCADFESEFFRFGERARFKPHGLKPEFQQNL